MTFCIITHVNHFKEDKKYYAYAPYVREMNIWLKYTDKVIVVAPLNKSQISAIDMPYNHSCIDFRMVPEFDITSFKNILRTLISLPVLIIRIYKAMRAADHIHLRCPGNMGLLGCLIQILFPKKKKTAKYAGNWDLNSQQPLSYRLQKWILRNTFLTKNMQVLVYGEWENQTKNIKPFFTATYSEEEYKGQKIEFKEYFGSKLRLLFVGTLSEGKRPLYALQLAEALHKQGLAVQLEICGEGIQRKKLEKYIHTNELNDVVFLRGNLSKDEIKEKYQRSHFLILPSKSEGWPKVVAEAMFWGCLPVATDVSCVANMIENRGILLCMNLEKDTENLTYFLNHTHVYKEKSEQAMSWSRQYTIEKFEEEISKLLIEK